MTYIGKIPLLESFEDFEWIERMIYLRLVIAGYIGFLLSFFIMTGTKTASFQKFLDEQQYTRNSILRYEVIFGQDHISPGGEKSAEEFCALLQLKKGQKVLDVGCGIGGSAFHCVRKYGVEVTAIDLSSNMIAIAKERQAEYGIDKARFDVADASTVQYGKEEFDAIFSRDTILHIEKKDLLFKQFYKWLKPGGHLMITDYVCGPQEGHSDEFKRYVTQRGYHLLTVPQYGKELENASFSNVQATDKTDSFMEILRNELEKFETKKEEFLKTFSLEDYNAIVQGWNDKLRRCGKGDQKWGLFYAEKL